MQTFGKTKILGEKGELYAAGLLQRKGYKIVEKNFKCHAGEIDLICVKDGTLVFVEVKTRRSLKYGLPEEAVTQSKIMRISKAGELYSRLHPELPLSLRIEVVSLLYSGGRLVKEKLITVSKY